MATWFGMVRTQWQLSRTRAQLLTLTDEQLRDVGLTRDQALAEARIAAWRGVRVDAITAKRSSLASPVDRSPVVHS